jgi:uncharacterized membrane protein YGL010W
MKNWLDKWLLRHLNPTSIVLHIIGIPACFIAAPILLIPHLWYWSAGAFVGGYILQFAGHAIEGNQSGEEILLRKLLGKTTAAQEPDKP